MRPSLYESARQIGRSARLDEAGLTTAERDALICSFSSNTHRAAQVFFFSRVNDEDLVTYIVQELARVHPSLEWLELDGCPVTTSYAKSIADATTGNPRLTRF